MDEARLYWLAARSRIYQWGDKSSAMLHRLCQRSMQPLAIPTIKNSEGVTLTDPQQIATSFASYFATLYASRETSADIVYKYIDDLPPRSLSDTVRDDLDAPLSIDEIQTALVSMNSGKAPGTNGFPCKFLKYNQSQLMTPYLALLMQQLKTAASCRTGDKPK